MLLFNLITPPFLFAVSRFSNTKNITSKKKYISRGSKEKINQKYSRKTEEKFEERGIAKERWSQGWKRRIRKFDLEDGGSIN